MADVASDSGKDAELYIKTGGTGVTSNVFTPDSDYGTWSNFSSGTEAQLAYTCYGAGYIALEINGTKYRVPIFTAG